MENIKDITITELNKKLAELREVIRTFHFSVMGARAKDVKLAKTTRVAIAQILTELNTRKENA